MSKTRKKKTWKAPPTRGKSKLAGKAPKSLKASSKANGKAVVKSRTSPRSQVLPGMEQARDSVLIGCCEDIASARTQMNASRLDEQAAIQRAMKRLQNKPKDAQRYRHGGVELALVEGVDKLRVRLTKDAEDTSSVETEAETGNEDLDGLGDGSQSTEIH